MNYFQIKNRKMKNLIETTRKIQFKTDKNSNFLIVDIIDTTDDILICSLKFEHSQENPQCIKYKYVDDFSVHEQLIPKNAVNTIIFEHFIGEDNINDSDFYDIYNAIIM